MITITKILIIAHGAPDKIGGTKANISGIIHSAVP